MIFYAFFCNFVAAMETRKKIWFIINPISGTKDKKDIVQMIPRYMDSSRFECETMYTERKGHAAEYVRRAIDENVDVCVAVGGDGTVNEVAKSLVHTQTALGIIPCGSGNGLARHLSIPMNPRGALQVLANCHIEALDYGCINGTPFFCTCGMGFDAFVSSKFAESGKRGFLSYIENTLREGLKYNPDTYEIEIEGERQRYKAFLIACANASQYGNNVYIAPKASMSDGLMDVTIMEPFNVLEAPQIAIQLFSKTITQNSRIKTFQCSRLKIHRSAPGVIHFDGDPKEEGTEIEVNIVPHDIRMVINDDERLYVPPLLGIFSDLYYDMNEEFTMLKNDFMESQHRISAINKTLLRKLRPRK